jgi:hypothetical protein
MPLRPTLATLLRRRSRGDVAAFVAALHAARGATTRADADADGLVVDGDRYLVVGGGYVARLRAGVSRRSPPPDVVVAVDPARAEALSDRYGVPVVTPTDLDRLARYGLDRPTADRVFRDHLGRGVDDVAPPSSTGSDPKSAPVSRSSTGWRGSPFGVPESAVVVLLVVAALVAFGAAAPSAGPEGVTLGEDDTAGPGAGPNETGVANEPRPTPATSTPRPDALRLAPGLTADGVTDPEALAEAHARAVANRSYTWVLTYVEYTDGDESGRAREVVTVERPTVYASRVSTDGFLTSRGPVAYRPSYADGERRYRPTVEGVDSTPLEQRGPTGLQEARASQYYGILLDGEETSVVRTILGDPRLYVVDITGANTSTVRNYTATAHVAPDGTVRYYAGSYCYRSFRSDTREVCLSLTMQYRDVGETTVEPPIWYTDAGTASPRATPGDGTETATATEAGTTTAAEAATPTDDPAATPTATPTATETRRETNGTVSSTVTSTPA